MLTDEQILQKAILLLEKISKNSDLTTEVLLREISDSEMKGVEAILQKLADNPKGVLAFDEIFGDKTRLVIPFPTTDTSTELGQFVNLLQNELGYDIEWEKGLIYAEKEFRDESLDADLARLQGREWKADRVKKIQMKIGKFFKKMADDGRKLNALHQKAMDWTFEYGDREVSQPQNLTGEEIEKALDDKERKYLYVLESNLNWYLGPDRDWKFGTKNIENFERLGEYWMKNAEYIKDNIENLENDQYSIILTRHPIDVMRMSDFDNITSCHTPSSRAGGKQEYYKCAVAEAQGHGAIAYVVETEELLSATNTGNVESAEQELEEYDEIFIEQARYLNGSNLELDPVSRTRLRQFRYYRDFDGEEEEYGKELAVPENFVYGLKVPGLISTVTSWARQKQEGVFDKLPKKDGKINLDNFEIYGGSYEDTQGYGGRKKLLSNLINLPVEYFMGQVRQNQETEQDMPPEWVGDVEALLKRDCAEVREKWNSGMYANCKVDFYVRDDSGEGDWYVIPEGKIMLTWDISEWKQLPNVVKGQDIADYLNQYYYDPEGASGDLFDDDKGAIYRGGTEEHPEIVWRCEFNNKLVPNMGGQKIVFDADGFEHFCEGINQLDNKRDMFIALVEQYAKEQGWLEGHAYISLAQKIENKEIGAYEWDVEYDKEHYTESYEAWATVSYDFDPEELGIEPRILFDLVDRREFALRLRGYLTAQAREETGGEYWLSIRNKSAVEVGGEVRYSITFHVNADTPDDLVAQFYELVTGDMDDEDEIAKAFMGALREEAYNNGVKLGQPPAEKQRNFDDLKNLGEVWRRFI